MNIDWLPQFIVSFVVITVVFNAALGACAYLIFLERKVASWVQDRIGPNRTNLGFGFLPEKIHMMGLGQALADGIKLLLKEDFTPNRVDKWLFWLAPAMVMLTATLSWAVIPWGGLLAIPEFVIPEWLPLIGGETIAKQMVYATAAPVNIGVVYILAISSLAVYGVVVGAYASNSKYSFLGGVRAAAQMLSYEIPQGLCVLVMIMLYASTETTAMVSSQIGGFTGMTWGIFAQPLLAVLFFTCTLAECNRAPFDLAEAEQELVGGFHTEYGSMKWALFFLGEYMNMITACAFFTLLFLGGWDILPFTSIFPEYVGDSLLLGVLVAFLKFGVFAGKVTALLFLMMWVRWTLPRLRFDQLMRMAWRALIPITIATMLATGFMIYFGFRNWWWFGLMNVVVVVVSALLGMYLPKDTSNEKLPLAGSRFSPLVEGE
ncbi:NADH-quinone oxidoreductase subunit H [Poriferisphaera corsica]|uniref:NADH-quinone oxidoreductase subunit H n=1 Tax=Poriferisphaera corsica TaxID=2528020 RepID=A0A517YVY4_9BACT|nr:complex I subunit 1 family protein [Poriferisphaera corsica]QDU34380.1 NADH-quinone oxidoreductase subunit H [Poriferisphaera corsica]